MDPVVVSAFNVANFPEGGGHFWVYLQYVLGLLSNGRDVFWLESFVTTGDAVRDATAITTFLRRTAAFGLEGRVILRVGRDPRRGPAARAEIHGMSAREAESVFERAGLLLNFHYAIDPALLGRFRRTALVDIDPGLLQFWISRGQLTVPRHDVYFTIGETVGTPAATFPDCGLPWTHIPPPVCLERWACGPAAPGAAMTTISTWDADDWVVDAETQYENTKRVAFLAYRDLPARTAQALELALYLRTRADADDRAMMERHGWRIRSSREVAGSPEDYRAYVQASRGEFSCAKPSCIRFQNAWVSDRTLCYLASGRPVVVQDTGPSGLLPNGEGMFRFSTLDQAAAALEAINADYARHSRAARALAERHFDARAVAARILEQAGA